MWVLPCLTSPTSYTTFSLSPPDTRLMDFTPRLFELSSTTGEFVASEVVYPARDSEVEATPFLQTEIYTTSQPGINILLFRYVQYII